MILHNITYNILPAIEKEWLAWIRHKLLPELAGTGLVAQRNILKLLTEIDNGGITFTLQLWFNTTEDYFTYQTVYAAAVAEKHNSRFTNQYVCFQTLLEEV